MSNNQSIDKKSFIDNFNSFLDSDKQKVLVTGLDDDAKVNAVIRLLNQKYKTGIIFCSSIGDIAELINSSFEKAVLRNKVTRNELYKMGKMTIEFKKYLHSLNSPQIGKNVDFSLYYPVQTVLCESNEEHLKNLILNISNNASKKVIVMTTNDHSLDLSPLTQLVDQHIHYEVRNDNPELLQIVQDNLGRKKIYSFE